MPRAHTTRFARALHVHLGRVASPDHERSRDHVNENRAVSAAFVVSGASEFAYLQPLLRQLHPWVDLSGVKIVDVNGDSEMPRCNALRR
jgi:hypothetical protein